MTRNDARIDAALLLLRLVTGTIFLLHGAQKLFDLKIAGVTAFFIQIGAPVPGITAPAVSLLEFFGGILLILGLLTRLVGLGLTIDMVGAILLVHLAGGFFAPKGYEFVLLLGTTAAVLAISGPGAWSADAILANRRKLKET